MNEEKEYEINWPQEDVNNIVRELHRVNAIYMVGLILNFLCSLSLVVCSVTSLLK
ncbi:MAG: hypothetical protein LBR94_04310 [Desulfovibrio sp.]|jgi:hypothetical protein|nr:hypothetical protein [Desulfovibrio sp.]